MKKGDLVKLGFIGESANSDVLRVSKLVEDGEGAHVATLVGSGCRFCVELQRYSEVDERIYGYLRGLNRAVMLQHGWDAVHPAARGPSSRVRSDVD